METEKKENKKIIGIPGLVFLPLHVYDLEEINEQVTFSIPMVGKFSEMYPDFFELANKNEDTDCFEIIIDSDNRPGVLSMLLIEVMLASSSYPALEKNQVFSLSSLVLDYDENVLYITGGVLEINGISGEIITKGKE